MTVSLRDNRGDGVFVNHFLLAVTVKQNDKRVKPAHYAAQLKSIGEKDSQRNSVLPCPV